MLTVGCDNAVSENHAKKTALIYYAMKMCGGVEVYSRFFSFVTVWKWQTTVMT
jgi:hypothetical protein